MCSLAMAISSFLTIDAVVRGYHIYLELRVEEVFVALHESGTPHDSHTMAVNRNEDPGVIVRHLPRELSRLYHYFTRHEPACQPAHCFH